jgi:hypothetical protein
MAPMKVSRDVRAPQRLLCLGLSGAMFVAVSMVGCGSGENVYELTPEAKKSVNASKIGDPSKFVKPKAGRRR